MARAMKRFTVVYERDETGWWVAQVKDAPEAITQGRTLAEARRRIREALGLVLGSDVVARQATLVDDVRLPPDARRAIAAVVKSRSRLEKDKQLLAKAMNEATTILLDTVGLSVRDTGEVLELSHQRIQQLKAVACVGALRGSDLRARVHQARKAPWTVG
jgi:predicted RNase H-like HicB family nuclease